MRWLVEVTSLGKSEKESLFVEAESWQKALQAARAQRGETAPMSGFSIELLDEGCRAVDPMSRLRYEVRKAPEDGPADARRPPPRAARGVAARRRRRPRRQRRPATHTPAVRPGDPAPAAPAASAGAAMAAPVRRRSAARAALGAAAPAAAPVAHAPAAPAPRLARPTWRPTVPVADHLQARAGRDRGDAADLPRVRVPGPAGHAGVVGRDAAA